MKFLSSPISEIGNLQDLAHMGLVQKAQSVIPRFEAHDGLLVLFSGSSQTLDDVFGCARALLRYASFAASARPDLVCVETLNCSQNIFQLSISPSKVGTSSLGSLTDLVSGTGEVVLVFCERRSLRTCSEQSKMLFSMVPSASSNSPVSS